MHHDETVTDPDLLAATTGFDHVRARFTLGLERGRTSGDVVGGSYSGPPLLNLPRDSATIVRTASGAVVTIIQVTGSAPSSGASRAACSRRIR